jgi:hypothetical protein
MKKLIPVLFVVMILATGCPQPEPEVHQVEIGLFTPYVVFPETVKGKVKEVVERNYLGMEQDGKVIKGERLTVDARDSIQWTNDFRLTYDENGNLLLTEQLDENDEIIELQKQTVVDGRIVKSESTRDDTLRNYSKMSYNDAGHLSKIEVFRMPVDTLRFSVLLSSDEQGNAQEWQFRNHLGDPTTKYLFTVNQEGRRTGYTFYDKEGKLVFEEKFIFNEMGFLAKQVMINEEGEESVSEYEYEYDEMNNWVKVIGNSDQHILVAERTFTFFPE